MPEVIDQKRPKCPQCGSSNVAEILWGMPVLTEELERELNEGRIVLGGCCVDVDDPDWHCNDCECEFGDRLACIPDNL